MNLYAIFRLSAWSDGPALEATAARSTQVGEEQLPHDVRWIRSYVLDEPAGGLGTVCLYEATGPEAIRRHAELAGLAVDEVVAVADTVIVRPDPAPARA